jgi:hypothetical protein
MQCIHQSNQQLNTERYKIFTSVHVQVVEFQKNSLTIVDMKKELIQKAVAEFFSFFSVWSFVSSFSFCLLVGVNSVKKSPIDFNANLCVGINLYLIYLYKLKSFIYHS